MNDRQGSQKSDHKQIDPDAKQVVIAIRKKPLSPKARLRSRAQQLSRAKKKVNDLIDKAQTYHCANLMSAGFIALGFNCFAIGASSDYHDFLVENGAPEGMLSPIGLGIGIAIFTLLALYPQCLKLRSCSQNAVTLNQQQGDELARIVRYYQVPIVSWYLRDPIEVRARIEQAQAQINNRIAAGMFGYPDPIMRGHKLDRSEKLTVERRNKRGLFHSSDAKDEKADPVMMRPTVKK